jgi:hypothetical protein
MSTTFYTPGAGNTPFGEPNANPEASNYAQESGFSPTETLLLEKAVKQKIFDASPAQYKSLKLLFSKGFEEKTLTEFSYIEKTFGRSVLESQAGSAAVPAVPNTVQTQNITLTPASVGNFSLDMIIIYPDNSKATIVAIAGNVITVNSHTGFPLPAVVAGDIFAIQSTINADARDHVNIYTRMETVERYNYIQRFIRARRWGSFELQEWINAGKTNYLDMDKKENMEQLRVDMFNSFWNGQRGEVQLEDGTLAKAMGGIYPLMQAANAAEGFTTLAAFEDTFKALAFTTNFKAEGETRFIYGTDEMLHNFAEVFKLPQVRYAPNDEMANLNLEMIKLGTMKFVMVPCELWREESCFPADWQRRVIVLDQETVRPCKLKGKPAFDAGDTLDMRANGTLNDFKDWWVASQLSIEFNNPLASFILNIQ